jgi:PIN domain nuclease of toxin-antitoxin system
MTLLTFPADAARAAAKLPQIHRDPVDRMTIAHALSEDLILVTADANMRKYPVRLL